MEETGGGTKTDTTGPGKIGTAEKEPAQPPRPRRKLDTMDETVRLKQDVIGRKQLHLSVPEGAGSWVGVPLRPVLGSAPWRPDYSVAEDSGLRVPTGFSGVNLDTSSIPKGVHGACPSKCRDHRSKILTNLHM